MGPAAKSARELEAIGREFAFTLIQQFAYNRMVQEMERRGATLASEEVNENGDIVLRPRHWKVDIFCRVAAEAASAATAATLCIPAI